MQSVIVITIYHTHTLQVLRKLKLHSELCSSYELLITTAPFDLKKLQRLFNYQQSLDEEVITDMKLNLLQDVHTLHALHSEMLPNHTLQDAFDNLESKQIFKINELSALVQKTLVDNRIYSQLAPIDEEAQHSVRRIY